ncbi:MAG: hypothetical protein A4E53_01648 [Pelotomaculum sp. PtaB.Bin104]|nr:MAG: hypothetical protein A4E53_01648 [Pelotomaculum sp. PtaB.Bin104]
MEIISNGSKWAGEENDSLDKLIEMIKIHPLDIYTFGAFGFCSFNNNHEGCDIHSVGDQTVWVHGNFLCISYVFNLRGTYDELRPIIREIENNIKRNFQTK